MPIWRFLCFVLAVSALCAFVGLSIHQQLIYASTLNFSADFLFSCLHFQLCTLMCMCMFQYSTTIDLCIYVEFQFGFGDFYVPCFQFQLYTFMCMCMFQYSTTINLRIYVESQCRFGNFYVLCLQFSSICLCACDFSICLISYCLPYMKSICSFNLDMGIQQQSIYASMLNFGADFHVMCFQFQLYTLMLLCMFQYSSYIILFTICEVSL